MRRNLTAVFFLWFAAISRLAAEDEVRVQLDVGGRPVLRWTVSGNYYFRLESAQSLHASNWALVPFSQLNFLATGYDTQAQDLQPPASARFYRLRSVGGLTNGVMHTVVDASGNGDHTTLVAALDSLPPEGGVVVLQPGTYAGGLTIPSHVTLRGAGIGQTRLLAPTEGNGQALLVSGSNVVIEAMTLAGQRAARSVPPDEVALIGVITVDGANVTVRNCHIHDAPNFGVLVGVSVPGFLIENSVVENSATNNVPQGTPGGHGYGIFCAGSASPIIRSNVVRGWAQAVGLWPGVTNGLVEHNQIVDNFGFLDAAHTSTRSACEDYGAATAPHGWNLWRSNLVDGSTSHCLEIAQGVTASRFVGNTLRRPGQISNYGNHWEVTGVSGQTNRDVVIEGNVIISDGLRADHCSVNGFAYNTVISNNTFTGFNHSSSLGPIFLGGRRGVRGTIVVSNTITASRYGVRVNADTTEFLVRGNTFTDARQSDAVIWADTTGSGRIEGNTVTGSEPVVGIKLTGLGAGQTGTLVADNWVRVAAGGIWCFTSSNVIRNNVFDETIANGSGTILLSGPNALGNLVVSNVVTTLGPWAIRLSSGADFNTITNNVIPPFTLRIDGSAGVNNVLSGN